MLHSFSKFFNHVVHHLGFSVTGFCSIQMYVYVYWLLHFSKKLHHNYSCFCSVQCSCRHENSHLRTCVQIYLSNTNLIILESKLTLFTD